MLVKNKKGSITLEAAIIVPVFIYIILSVIFLVKVVYIHEKVEQALYNAADEIVYDNILNRQTGSVLIPIKVYKYLGHKEDKIFIDLSSSFYNNGIINITAKYNLTPPTPISAGPQINVLQRAYVKDWTRLKSNENEKQNIWDLPPLERGKKIQKIFNRDHDMPHNFPVIAKFNNNTAVSIKSIDLNSKHYKKDYNIERRLKQCINDLYNFDGGKVGNYAIYPYEIHDKKIIVVIPKGTKIKNITVLNKCRDYANSKKILFEVNEL